MTIDPAHIILGSMLAGAPLVTFEIISRVKPINPEISRKLTHVFASVAAILLTLFCSLHEIAVLGLIFFVVFILTRRKQVWRSLYMIKRDTWGELLFPLGLSLAALIAPSDQAFIIAMLFLGFSDTIANLLGQKYGKRHLPVLKSKTWIGTLACLASCYIIGAIFAGQFLSLHALVLALAVTAAEALGTMGFDNLFVPVAAVLFIRLFGI